MTFADLVEVFSIKGGDDEKGGSSGGSKLVHGQRVTLEEDATLMEAMRDYAEVASLALYFLHSCDSEQTQTEWKLCP